MIADKILNFIDGEYVATDKWYENRNPINNKVIGMVAEAGERIGLPSGRFDSGL